MLRPYISSIGAAGSGFQPPIFRSAAAIQPRRQGCGRYQDSSVLVVEINIRDLDILRHRIDLKDLLVAQRE